MYLLFLVQKPFKFMSRLEKIINKKTYDMQREAPLTTGN